MHETLFSGLEDEDALAAVAEVIENVFDRWGINEPDRRRLLDTAEETLTDVQHLRSNPIVLERIGQLLAIDRAVEAEDSGTSKEASWWIRTPHPALSGESPLSIMLMEGTRGMKKVRAIVEPNARLSP